MSSQAPTQLRRWLEAERTDSAAAEEALAVLFEALPAVTPAVDFAARVVARVRKEAVAPFRHGVRRRALTGLVWAFCLFTSLTVIPWLLGPVAAALAGGPSLLGWLAEGVARASQLLVALMAGLHRLFELAQGFAATAARTPSIAFGVLLALGLAALAFWLLERTLSRERMVPHASC